MKLRYEEVAAKRPLALSAQKSLSEAQELFARSGAQALVVLDEGVYVGVLERRVLEKALAYGLEESAGALADPEAPVLAEDTPVNEDTLAAALRTPSSVVVILRGKKPVGTFSVKEAFLAGLSPPPPRRFSLSHLPTKLQSLLAAVGEVATRQKVPVFLVGGGVRDLLLGREIFDLDFVVSEQAEELATALARHLSGNIKARSQFGTYKLGLADGQVLDVAQSRWEYYEAPAKLPKVFPGPLWEDLFRRDFTVNALALVLSGPRAGEVIDPFGGVGDLRRRRLRLHHSLSLVDDPTRIFRAARYLVRFALTPGPCFAVALALVRRHQVLKLLSPARVRRELERILEEPSPAAVFSQLLDLGVWDTICEGNAAVLEPEVLALFEWLEGLEIERKDLLQALALLFEKAGPGWKRLYDFSPGQAERLAAELAELSSQVGRLLSEPRRSRKVALLERYSLPVLLVFAARTPLARSLLREYLVRLKDLRPTVSGKDLLAAGFAPGPEVGRVLRRLREAWLDGEISSPEEEEAWLKREFPHEFS